jgi:hypothetical protein
MVLAAAVVVVVDLAVARLAVQAHLMVLVVP